MFSCSFLSLVIFNWIPNRFFFFGPAYFYVSINILELFFWDTFKLLLKYMILWALLLRSVR